MVAAVIVPALLYSTSCVICVPAALSGEDMASPHLLHQDPAIPQKKISTVCGATAIAVLAESALIVSPVAGKTLGPVAVADWLMTVISIPTLAGGSFTLSPAVATVWMKQFMAVN